ncbi:MAG: hypothetical protein K2Q21_10385 [Chitinophagaceae bacterium]|nr:hypothetical protein [Chitinophagaceae bacterium]
MSQKIKTIFTLVAFSITITSFSQEKGKIFFTTAFGLISAQGKLSNAYKSTVTFNSGVELALKKDWFGQFVLDFNALKYDQQIRDNNSAFLFKNTNSSLLLFGLNFGKNVYFKNKNWFTSFYGGSGYLNIGEPRLQVDPQTNIALQEVVRKSSVFARTGARIAFKTKSSFFQTIFLDGSYWASPTYVQDGRVNGFSVYIGTRFGVIQ